MKTLTSTIRNAKSKVMRTAWHLFRTTGVSFAESLKQAWRIIKDTFVSIETETGKCFLENGKNIYRKVARDAKAVNKEIVSKIVFLTKHFIEMMAFEEKLKQSEVLVKSIKAKYHPIMADHLIHNTSLD